MSIHKSLSTKGALVRSRNVLTRYERLAQLRRSGKWSEVSDSPFHLPSPIPAHQQALRCQLSLQMLRLLPMLGWQVQPDFHYFWQPGQDHVRPISLPLGHDYRAMPHNPQHIHSL